MRIHSDLIRVQKKITPRINRILRFRNFRVLLFFFFFFSDDTTPKGGTIFLGGINPKHMQGPITYLRVTRLMYWQVEMNQ